MFGIVALLQIFFFSLIMTDEEKRQHQSLMQQYDKKHSGVTVLFCSLFAILVAAAAYSGWSEFDTGGFEKECLLSVKCYQQNDLAIIAAAGLKCFAIFGFLGGAALMVWGNFKRRL